MTRRHGEVALVHSLACEGLNQSQIARATGIPRRTVRDWLDGRVPTPDRGCPGCNEAGTPPLSVSTYAYLLGLYLGDGYISTHRNGVHRLRIVQDAKYPGLVTGCAEAMALVMPASKVLTQDKRGGNCIEISSYSKHWPCLFPQHGRGRKHERRIELAGWQLEIVRRHPRQLLRGLIHSDGCRVLNRVNGHDYPRYMFTQVSDDIRGIFCLACDLVGVSWTQTNSRTISVARRPDVALLDGFIGPKA